MPVKPARDLIATRAIIFEPLSGRQTRGVRLRYYWWCRFDTKVSACVFNGKVMPTAITSRHFCSSGNQICESCHIRISKPNELYRHTSPLRRTSRHPPPTPLLIQTHTLNPRQPGRYYGRHVYLERPHKTVHPQVLVYIRHRSSSRCNRRVRSSCVCVARPCWVFSHSTKCRQHLCHSVATVKNDFFCFDAYIFVVAGQNRNGAREDGACKRQGEGDEVDAGQSANGARVWSGGGDSQQTQNVGRSSTTIPKLIHFETIKFESTVPAILTNPVCS